MKNYLLKEDEVCLFEARVYEQNTAKDYDFMLTNFNIVLFASGDDNIIVYPITEVKYYEGKPYIKINKNLVEIYLKACVLKCDFTKSGKHVVAQKFFNEFMKLLTGKSAFERVSDKFKETVEVIDNTLGINTIESAKNIIANASSKGKKGNKLLDTIEAVGIVSKSIVKKKEEKLLKDK